jgi:hypothetical protein
MKISCAGTSANTSLHHHLLTGFFSACFLLIYGLSYFVYAQNEDNDAAFRAELENIRALPFAQTVVCEAGDLKIKSPRSATFVIRRSQLCRRWIERPAPPAPARFILCSNDPAFVADDAPVRILKCRQLDKHWFSPDIAI